MRSSHKNSEGSITKLSVARYNFVLYHREGQLQLLPVLFHFNDCNFINTPQLCIVTGTYFLCKDCDNLVEQLTVHQCLLTYKRTKRTFGFFFSNKNVSLYIPAKILLNKTSAKTEINIVKKIADSRQRIEPVRLSARKERVCSKNIINVQKSF